MNVFDIVRDYESLMAEIEELGGEITPEIAEKLNINQEELEKKIKAYYAVIKLREAEIKVAKDEQERLATVVKSKEGLIKRLKKTVDLAVETFGELKPSGAKGIKFADLNVWQKKTEALQLLEDAIIDDERFCSKQFLITCSYKGEDIFINRIFNAFFLSLSEEENNKIKEEISISTLPIKLWKDRLKTWLLENEEYCKELKTNGSVVTLVDEKDSKTVKDTNIALVASIVHNSTIIFK